MSYDVAVVGGGLVGLAIARQVAREGARVVVIDRDEPCKHASWAAAGMLSPQAEADVADDFLSLLLSARARFPNLTEELRAETGLDIGYRTHGTLLLAFNQDDEAHLEHRFRWQREAELPIERLTAAEIHALEPGLSENLRWGLRFEGDHQVDNRLLGQALWIASEAAGADFRIGSGVRRVRLDERPRLDLEDGNVLEAGVVVLAAGSWSGRIAGLPRSLPVEPVHGELISVHAAPPLLHHTLGSPRGYIVPRADGRLILGTTVERIGFRTRVTAGGVQRIIASGMEMLPSLARRPLAATWSGLRPGTPDGLPILGPDPEYPHLIYATGHFRNGVLLAPLTGELVGGLALGKSVAGLETYRPDRFAKTDR